MLATMPSAPPPSSLNPSPQETPQPLTTGDPKALSSQCPDADSCPTPCLAQHSPEAQEVAWSTVPERALKGWRKGAWGAAVEDTQQERRGRVPLPE